MSERENYQRKYYRTRTIAKLRDRIKSLEETLQMFRDSPEGKDYFQRKTKEYQKEYREHNRKKIEEYRKHYATF